MPAGLPSGLFLVILVEDCDEEDVLEATTPPAGGEVTAFPLLVLVRPGEETVTKTRLFFCNNKSSERSNICEAGEKKLYICHDTFLSPLIIDNTRDNC